MGIPYRILRHPVDKAQLAPPDPDCRLLQFDAPLTEGEHRQVGRFLTRYSHLGLRVYGHSGTGLRDLAFLRHYPPSLRRFQVDVEGLESLAGLEFLPPDLASFGLGATKSTRLSLGVLRAFSELRELFIEGHTKDIHVLADLPKLESLTLRSVTLPDLSVLSGLPNLRRLRILLGGTTQLEHLRDLRALSYLELWMVKGLTDVGVIARCANLETYSLQQLKHVKTLPDGSVMSALRHVHLDAMQGITDLRPASAAPRLQSLHVTRMAHLKTEDFACFVGHKTLSAMRVALGSSKQNDQVKALLKLPDIKTQNLPFGA